VRGLDLVAKRANVDADALADALLKIEDGTELSHDDRALIEQVLDELGPKIQEQEPAVDEKGLEVLALKKAKLKLLMGL